jgi:Zn-finger nucleic acid-binding protein
MNGTASPLTCPKCGGEMRSYERNGVTVDQCGECRGIFLDRGELERLIDAESSHYEREYADRDRDEGSREKRSGEKPKKSKKRSFLENLMEGMGE